MTGRIEPALTPEEWARETQLRIARFGTQIEASERHRYAALLLYGMPFGFTHEDVELLRSLSFSARRHQGNPFDMRVHSLADRLAALLPHE